MQGQVKFFNVARHFGFINLTDESGELIFAEYFFSGNDVIGDFPQRGDTVEFIVEDPPSRARRRDLIAVEVQKVTDRSEIVTLAPDVFEKLVADEELAHAC